MDEVWKDIDGYEGKYQISNLGNVRRVYKSIDPKILKLYKHEFGYLRAYLCQPNGKRRCERVHRLVAKAFIPNPNNYSDVNHIDEIKTNNRVDNLEWCNRSQNILHSLSLHKERGLMCAKNNLLDENGYPRSKRCVPGKPHTRFERVNQYTTDGEFIKTHDNASAAAYEMGCVKSKHILAACQINANKELLRTRTRKAMSAGFVWEFAE